MLKDTFIEVDDEGNEESYFCNKFLIVKYLNMSDADLELNAKYKAEEKEAAANNESLDNSDYEKEFADANDKLEDAPSNEESAD